MQHQTEGPPWAAPAADTHIAVGEARGVRQDLLLDLRRLGLAQCLHLLCGGTNLGERDRWELCILEGESSDERGDGVDESECLKQVGLAVGEEEGEQAVEEEDSARDRDCVADGEANLEGDLRHETRAHAVLLLHGRRGANAVHRTCRGAERARREGGRHDEACGTANKREEAESAQH
eukprot:scaffold49796_cov33-Tisochrysis_lutea.AAC.1